MPERMTQVLLTALRRQRPAGDELVEVEVTDPERALAAVDAAVLATMYGDSPVGIAVVDPTGRYLRINDLIARNNGPTPAEHVGRTLEDVLGDDAPAVRAQLDQVLRSGEPVTGQDVLVHDASGEARTWQVTWFPARDPGTGRIVAAVCVASDVSDTRREEGERLRAQERTRVLARSGELLAAGLSSEQVLDAVVDLFVPGLADWCVVHVVAANGAIEPARERHADPSLDAALRRLMASVTVRPDQTVGAGAAIATGRTLRYKQVSDDVLERVS